MDDDSSFHANQCNLADRVRVLRLLRDEQLSSSESRREWGKILEQRFKGVFGEIDLEDAERELLCISGEQLPGPVIKQMALSPSSRSAFTPYINPQK